jgi:hypothetical protein
MSNKISFDSIIEWFKFCMWGALFVFLFALFSGWIPDRATNAPYVPYHEKSDTEKMQELERRYDRLNNNQLDW